MPKPGDIKQEVFHHCKSKFISSFWMKIIYFHLPLLLDCRHMKLSLDTTKKASMINWWVKFYLIQPNQKSEDKIVIAVTTIKTSFLVLRKENNTCLYETHYTGS